MSPEPRENRNQEDKGVVSPQGRAKYRNLIFGAILLVIISVVVFVLISASLS